MESFQLESDAGRQYLIRIEEVSDFRQELTRTLIEIDLQTFSESTFSHYTAAAFLRSGRVFLLRADDAVIGTCVCIRSWERPADVLLLSMGIRPGWRGRGLGQRFVEGVLGKLRLRGMRSVTLLLSKGNRRAARVYTEVGFELVDELPEDPLTGESLYVMRCKLRDEASLTELPLTPRR